MAKDHRLNLKQWLDHVKETYEGYGYSYEFIGISDVQLNIERTKPSLGSYTELPPGLRSKTKVILNIRNNKFNCLQLCNTAALFPVTDLATRENKYFNNLVDDWEDNENIYDYLISLQNQYNTNIWFYRPSNEDKPTTEDRPSTEDNVKVGILQKYSNFVKGCKNVRIIFWNEHCALFKIIEVLLEGHNTQNTNYWFCVNCSVWFPTQQKYETHERCTQIKPNILCPKIKQTKFKNHFYYK